MDDFGTGYSSFALLKEMPLDTLKIDKSFVDLIVKNEDNDKITIILHHIITMAKEMGINSIAEGVEEYAQLEALREWGCEMVQGYYYSKPLPIGEFEEKYLR
jgi:sensor c-di-GMP phosphodiesterase-like protein